MGNRRDFVKKSCLICMGLGGMASILESCASAYPIVKTSSASNKFLTVPLSTFANQVKIAIVRDDKLNDDLLLVKNEKGFKALIMVCTHEINPLYATDTRIICNAHGAQFDFNGQVIKEPALYPLDEYKTEIINNNVHIYINKKYESTI